MAYECPRCGQSVKRGRSNVAQIGGGVVGAMVYAAFESFQCEKCGKIARKEFSIADQDRMMRGSIALAVGALVLLGFVVWLLVWR